MKSIMREACYIHYIYSYFDMFYDTSFLARILVIRDGDVKPNPGPNDNDYSIKKQETLRVGVRPKKSGFKGKITKKESSVVPRKPNFFL